MKLQEGIWVTFKRNVSTSSKKIGYSHKIGIGHQDLQCKSIHRVCPLHFCSCLDWLDYQVRLQRTVQTAQSHQYSLSHFPRTVLMCGKELEKSHGSLTSRTLPLWTVASGWRYRVMNIRIARHWKSFLPQAIYLMNSLIKGQCTTIFILSICTYIHVLSIV